LGRTRPIAEGETPNRLGDREVLVAVAGNPNTGKTTLFNKLTGSDLKVGNYPGVTVDCHTGRLDLSDGTAVRLMDVPGTYSLSARSQDEQIAVQAVAGLDPLELPGLVVAVVDATQVTRNLYLTLQTIEMNVPVVIALNMADAMARTATKIDVEAMSRELGVPVVATSASLGTGIDELRREIEATVADPRRGQPGWRWMPQSNELQDDIAAVERVLPPDWAPEDSDRRRALAVWALLSIDGNDELSEVPPDLRRVVDERHELANAAERSVEEEVIRGRYSWIDEHSPRFLLQGQPTRTTRTSRVDSVLLNPVFGFVIFLAVMGLVFQSLFAWADPAISGIETLFGALAGLTKTVLPEGLFRDFLTEGLIAGVGSVVVFLPQILLLFFFIGVMEASGYMARVAFLMDRVMKKLGLHGRAFVPMMSGFACAIPAIMATRTMERRRDRMLTMMVVPLMTCSARLPVYTLIIAALFPPQKVFGVPVQGLLMVGMYFFGTLTALAALAVLSRTLFKGPPVPLVLELPPYRLPHWSSVLRMMWQKGRVFLTEAGTVILICTVVLWVLLSFPKDDQISQAYDLQRTEVTTVLTGEPLAEALGGIDAEESGAYLRDSFGGRLGRLIEPVIAPLGFDWKLGIGIIGAFAAREVFVSTMGVVYGVGDDVDEESVTLREKIKSERHEDGRAIYTPLMGLSLMVFFSLACQCMSTLAAVYRETHTWRWPVFLFTYMTVLAWIASFIIYQGGRLIGFD